MEKELHSADIYIGLDILDLIDSLPFYAMLVDEHHYIILANRAVQTYLELDPKEIVGRYCPKVVHGIDEPFYGCPLEEAVKTGQSVEREVLDEKSGRWLGSAIYPTGSFTRDGRKVFFHMVVDITDRKEAEEQLRLSHERLRSLSAHLESVREEERKKIAHDLHDETSQVVASLNAYLEAAIGKLPANSNETRALLRKAQDSSIQILDQLHKLIYELRPTIIDDFGLVAAIKWLIENSLEVAGINVVFKVIRQEKRLSTELKTAIFRVVQEAINNILKHANARNVIISFHFKKNAIRIRIKDNGAGFDVEKAINSKDRPRGLGIVGMKERIELFEGTFKINSSCAVGTEINIEIPLTE